MKLSVSLPASEVAILDEFVRSAGLPSRSAAVQIAVRSLRLPELEAEYETAWAEWESSGEHAAWDVTAVDALADAAR
ncbi:MAG: ribbon-helix-helix domain-containing protein [Nocardioides sp.]